jgi:hypothetical protein
MQYPNDTLKIVRRNEVTSICTALLMFPGQGQIYPLSNILRVYLVVYAFFLYECG